VFSRLKPQPSPNDAFAGILSYDIMQKILMYVDALTLVRISQLNSYCYKICQSSNCWQALYQRTFGITEVPWKQLFQHQTISQKATSSNNNSYSQIPSSTSQTPTTNSWQQVTNPQQNISNNISPSQTTSSTWKHLTADTPESRARLFWQQHSLQRRDDQVSVFGKYTLQRYQFPTQTNNDNYNYNTNTTSDDDNDPEHNITLIVK